MQNSVDQLKKGFPHGKAQQSSAAKISAADTSKDIDIHLIPETPTAPGNPVVVLWLKDRLFHDSAAGDLIYLHQQCLEA